ncbi:hypothetical protein AUJ13_04405 [Candidatus Micrarchaeota archaeon CG1_02_49_24]|nr:MAG: hypothetical protein AUJ13_04405 [Candidatus Micrarchaeota archaeon CG1_02_49_24]
MEKIAGSSRRAIFQQEDSIADGISMIQAEDRLSSNIYVVEGKGKEASEKEIMLIDTGDGKTDIARIIGKKPALVILTHNHYDHSQGVKEEWNVYLHPKDFEEREFAYVPKNAKKINFESIIFHDFELESYNTPGHTPGSIVLLEKKTRILFSGDTLFANGCPGRTDLEGGNERDMEKSLGFLETLDYRILCPGHDQIERKER